jgi:molybdopterin-binding protein
MKLSARNQFKEKILELKNGAVMSQIKLVIGNGNIITALIGKDSADELSLNPGDEAVAIIKSTEVIIGKL